MLSDEEVYALTGVPRQIVVDLASAVGASRNTVGIVLFVLKHTPTWDLVALIWSRVLKEPPVSERALRRRVRDTAAELNAFIDFDGGFRLHTVCDAFLNVTCMIDCTPLRIRGNASSFNGKYFAKVRKYQVLCDLRGIPFDVRPVNSRSHDAATLRVHGIPALGPRELILGDKGYIGFPNILTPFKKSKHNQLTIEKRNFNDFPRKNRTGYCSFRRRREDAQRRSKQLVSDDRRRVPLEGGANAAPDNGHLSRAEPLVTVGAA